MRVMSGPVSTSQSTSAAEEVGGGDGAATLATGDTRREANVLFSSPFAAHAWSSQLLIKKGSKPVTACSQWKTTRRPPPRKGPPTIWRYEGQTYTARGSSIHRQCVSVCLTSLNAVPFGNPPYRSPSLTPLQPLGCPAASRYTPSFHCTPLLNTLTNVHPSWDSMRPSGFFINGTAFDFGVSTETGSGGGCGGFTGTRTGEEDAYGSKVMAVPPPVEPGARRTTAPTQAVERSPARWAGATKPDTEAMAVRRGWHRRDGSALRGQG